MEFPDLGKNCSEPTCKQLDFLPVKCDSCRKIFCMNHFAYNSHNCAESYKKDNQVPVCPLCNKPIPVPKGQLPDVMVGQHIDTDCQSDPAREKRGKIFSNKCSKKGCKQKELVPVLCEKCQLNYCLKHRFETDHNCKGFQGSGKGISKAGAAAVGRLSTPNNSPSVRPSQPPQQANILSNLGRDLNRDRVSRQRALQGGMTEDEALAHALAASMTNDSNPAPPAPRTDEERQRQEESDAALARALQQSEQRPDRRTNRQSSNSDRSCEIS